MVTEGKEPSGCHEYIYIIFLWRGNEVNQPAHESVYGISVCVYLYMDIYLYVDCIILSIYIYIFTFTY